MSFIGGAEAQQAIEAIALSPTNPLELRRHAIMAYGRVPVGGGALLFGGCGLADFAADRRGVSRRPRSAVRQPTGVTHRKSSSTI